MEENFKYPWQSLRLKTKMKRNEISEYNLTNMINLVNTDKKLRTIVNGMTKKEKIEFIRKYDNLYIDKWIKSNCKDLNMYQERDFLYSLICSYLYHSRGAVLNAYSWMVEKLPNYKNLTYFDDYNGCGFTTIDLLLEGLNVSFYNGCQYQLDYLDKLCKLLKIDKPYLDIDRKKKYDVLISFGVIEHYEEPIPYLETITKMIKKGGYLVETSGFSPKQIWAGHYREYLFEGEYKTPRSMSRVVGKYKKEHYDYVFRFFNGHPRVYKLKSGE